MTIDRQTLEMAIRGFDQQIAVMMEKRNAAELQLSRLTGVQGKIKVFEWPKRKPRKLSPGARRRIAAAQRKRWREYRAKKAAK